MIKYLSLVFLIIFVLSCSTETIYYGKLLNQEDLNNINFKNQDTLVKKLGKPSFIDPVDNKYFYYSEKKIKKSFIDEKVMFSYIFVFEFDNDNNIVSSNVYDLKNKSDIKFVKEITENEVIKRGLIESIFGGVGAQQEIPITP